MLWVLTGVVVAGVTAAGYWWGKGRDEETISRRGELADRRMTPDLASAIAAGPGAWPQLPDAALSAQQEAAVRRQIDEIAADASQSSRESGRSSKSPRPEPSPWSAETPVAGEVGAFLHWLNRQGCVAGASAPIARAEGSVALGAYMSFPAQVPVTYDLRVASADGSVKLHTHSAYVRIESAPVFLRAPNGN